MLDITRYRNILIIAVCLGLILLGFNFVLLAAAGPCPDWLVPSQDPSSWGDIKQSEARVGGLQVATGQGSAAGQQPFCVYFGLSTAREGIDPEVLRGSSGTHERAAGLCGNGHSIEHVLDLTAPLVHSGLKPSLAIVCVHPANLAGKPSKQPPPSLNPLPHIIRGEWSEAAVKIGWCNWYSSNRLYVHHAVRAAWHNARMGLGVTARETNPWSAPRRLGYPEHADDYALRQQLIWLESFGWFDGATYARHQQKQASALVKIISDLRGLDCEVIVVIMPEQTLMRNRVPAEARQYLLDTLEKQFADSPLAIWQLQSAIPDSMFTDYYHMNDAGRATFSAQLSSLIKQRRTK